MVHVAVCILAWLAVVVVAIRVTDVWRSALRALRDGRVAPKRVPGRTRTERLLRPVWRWYVLPILLSLPLIAAGLTEVGEQGGATDAHHRSAPGLRAHGHRVRVRLCDSDDGRLGFNPQQAADRQRRPRREARDRCPVRGGAGPAAPRIFADVAIAATFFDAFHVPEYPYPSDVSGRTIYVADEVVGVVGLQMSPATNWPALLTKWVVLATVALYVLVVFTTSVGSLRNRSSSPESAEEGSRSEGQARSRREEAWVFRNQRDQRSGEEQSAVST